MYAIYFTDNICVVCGCKNTIKTLDSRNIPIPSDCAEDIRRVVCSKCGAEYILQWNGDIFYPIDKNCIEEFTQKFNN